MNHNGKRERRDDVGTSEVPPVYERKGHKKFKSPAWVSSDQQTRPDFTRFIMELVRTNLRDIRPRVHNRTHTLQHGAITVKNSDDLHAAFALMVEYTISSLPVLTQQNEFCGFIRMPDIVWWLVSATNYRELEKTPEHLLLYEFKHIKVAEAMRMSCHRFSCHQAFTLWFAFEHLTYSNDVKEIAVVDSANHVQGIITQSMMIGELKNAIVSGAIHPDTCNIKVRFLKPAVAVLSLEQNKLAIDAFTMMDRHEGVTCIAVVDKLRRLVGVVSASDIQALFNSPFSCLDYTLWQFLHHLKQPTLVETCVTPDDTFAQCIRILDAYHIHHLFVVENKFSMKPVSVLTMADLMSFVMPVKSRNQNLINKNNSF